MLTVELISLAYEVFGAASNDQADAALLTEKALQLGKKRNKRSDYAHLSIDTAFAGVKISPSARTLYAKALRAAQIQGLTGDDFWQTIRKGPSGRGGLKHLAKSTNKFGWVASTAKADPTVRGSNGASRYVMLRPELAMLVDNLHVQRFILIVHRSRGGKLWGTAVVGCREPTPQALSSAIQRGANSGGGHD